LFVVIPLPTDIKPPPSIPDEPLESNEPIQQPIIADQQPTIADQQPSTMVQEEYVGPTMPQNIDNYPPMPSMYDDDDDEGVTAPYPSMPSMYDDDDDQGVTAPYPPMPSMYDDDDGQGVTAPYPSMPSMYDEESVTTSIKVTPKQSITVPPPPIIKKKLKNVSKMVPTALRVVRQSTTKKPLTIPSAIQNIQPTRSVVSTVPRPIQQPSPLLQQQQQPSRPIQRPPPPPLIQRQPIQQKKKNTQDEFANFMNEVSDLL
jgi:hypothetical protein